MPELPEVEIIKRQLAEHMMGHVVEDIEVRESRIVKGEADLLVGGRAVDFSRRGKGLVIGFDNGYSLVFHLKMTGQIIFRATELYDFMLSKKVGELPSKHTHVILKLKAETQNEQTKNSKSAFLYFNDIRKFGWVHVLPTEKARKLPFFQNLGPEPFVDLDERLLFDILQSSRSPVKNVLMDQRKIAGIGNIYANDALWMAKIDPRRTANSLSRAESDRLYEAILSVLEKSISQGAASDNTYVNALGGEGGYQNHFLVYHREGKECPRCGSVIERFTLGGRGTFWCPGCQK